MIHAMTPEDGADLIIITILPLGLCTLKPFGRRKLLLVSCCIIRKRWIAVPVAEVSP
jgi:hypothetical protein